LILCCIASKSTFAQLPRPKLSSPELHRVLVIPVNIEGYRPLKIERHQIAEALYGRTGSVAMRYRAISYGVIQFSGSASDIADTISLPAPPDFCDSGLGKLATQALNSVRRMGMQTDVDSHFAFILPTDIRCRWTGLGDIDGKRIWVRAMTARAFQHELGHNLKLDHAILWQGPQADASDFMGSGAASLNAPHVIQMGWLQRFPDKVIQLQGPAEMALEPLDTDPKASRLPKVAVVQPSDDANTYYLSYRAASTDNPLADKFVAGLNIHIFSSDRRTGGRTYLVATLTDGTVFRDGPMLITQLSHIKGERVAFRIQFNGLGLAMPAGPPPAPIGSLQSLASGKCLDLARGAIADGTPVIQYECNVGRNQRWDVEQTGNARFRIVSRLSGKCLGDVDGKQTAGSAILHSACKSSQGQLWLLREVAGGYALQNVKTGLCLDVPKASADDGVPIITWTCNNGPNQTWRLASLEHAFLQ
jgi:Ricin-type beta-trefoil lectin domain/Gametolysin peptidase M11